MLIRTDLDEAYRRVTATPLESDLGECIEDLNIDFEARSFVVLSHMEPEVNLLSPDTTRSGFSL